MAALTSQDLEVGQADVSEMSAMRAEVSVHSLRNAEPVTLRLTFTHVQPYT